MFEAGKRVECQLDSTIKGEVVQFRNFGMSDYFARDQWDYAIRCDDGEIRWFKGWQLRKIEPEEPKWFVVKQINGEYLVIQTRMTEADAKELARQANGCAFNWKDGLK